MGFMKSVGKAITGPIGQGLSSLIPGVGPLISGALGMAGSAIGGSGNQGGVNMNQTGSFNQNQNYSGQTTTNQQTSGQTNILEDPLFAGYRKSLIPQLQQMQREAGQPLYGEAEKADYISGLNDLTNDSINSLRSSLAARGVADSGEMAKGAGDIQMGRFGQIAQYNRQIPLLNRQYKDQQQQGLLGMGMNLAQLGRLGQSTTGTTTGGTTTTGQSTTAGTNESQSQQRQIGLPWWKGVLNQAGQGIGQAIGGMAPRSQVGKLPMPISNQWKNVPGGNYSGAPWDF